MKRRAFKELLPAVSTLLFAVPAAAQDKPNILVIWGDDIGWSNISAYNLGIMGYQTPNIDRIAREGALTSRIDAQYPGPCRRGDSGVGPVSVRHHPQQSRAHYTVRPIIGRPGSSSAGVNSTCRLRIEAP